MTLPPDATATVFADGLPIDVTRREISHIFRPFEGYLDVRLIERDSVKDIGEKIYLGFIEFDSEVHAFTAMNIVNGYKLDDSTQDGYVMKLTFARSLRHQSIRDGGRHPNSNRGGQNDRRDRSKYVPNPTQGNYSNSDRRDRRGGRGQRSNGGGQRYNNNNNNNNSRDGDGVGKYNDKQNTVNVLKTPLSPPPSE